MIFKIICIVALLEFSLSEYDVETLPMDKDSKYGDDVCSYTDHQQKYVKSCEKGKFCSGSITVPTLDFSRGNYYYTSDLEICQDTPNVTAFYSYKESCTNDFECEGDYKCIGEICSYDYECNTNEFLYNEGTSRPICLPNSDKGTDGICYEEIRAKDAASIIKYSSPVPNKICGKLTLADDPNDNKKGIYYITKKEYVYKGEVEDGDYVTNEELCKSGFALKFYKDGKSKDPKDSSATGSNSMYLRCVTPISIISTTSSGSVEKCSINYKINDGEILKYNVKQFSSIPSEISNHCKSNDKLYIKLKHEKYREYYTNIKEEERKTCGDLDYTNQYTCENNELIKSWYYYKNPKDYTTYNNRKKFENVINYKIQKEYPCYSLSQFIGLNLIYLLFLLLF